MYGLGLMDLKEIHGSHLIMSTLGKLATARGETFNKGKRLISLAGLLQYFRKMSGCVPCLHYSPGFRLM